MAIFGTDFRGGLDAAALPAGQSGRAVAERSRSSSASSSSASCCRSDSALACTPLAGATSPTPQALTRSIMLGLLAGRSADRGRLPGTSLGTPRWRSAGRPGAADCPISGRLGWVAIVGGFLVGSIYCSCSPSLVLGIDLDPENRRRREGDGVTGQDPALCLIVVAGVAIGCAACRGTDLSRPDFRGAVANAARLGRRIGDHLSSSGRCIHIDQPVHAIVVCSSSWAWL